MFHTQKLKKILRLHQEALIWASWDRKNFKIVSACCHSEAFSLIELRGLEGVERRYEQQNKHMQLASGSNTSQNINQ